MIEVRELVKEYGDRKAVRGLDFRVEEGEILGFLGPNGAGKTTTMRILTGFLPPTSGTARIAGFDVQEQPEQVRARIGYLPETPPLYLDMTTRGYLAFVARLKGLRGASVRKACERAIERTGLGPVRDRILGHLSKGFRQRAGIAQAIVHEPPVLILDEPTVGLDPAQIIEIRDLIRGLAGDHTVILSTHILPEVASTCEKIVILHEGRLVREARLAELGDGESLERLFVEAISNDLAAAEESA